MSRPNPANPDESGMRQRIIESFLRLVVRIGIENITLQKVAKEAQVSYFAVHYHFGGGKRGMTDFATEYVAKKAQEYISQQTDAASLDQTASLLHAYVTGTFDWARALPHHGAFWLYYYYMCTCSTPIQTMNRQVLQAARRRVGRLLSEDVGRGIYTVGEAVTDDLVAAVHSQVAGAVMMAQAEGTSEAMERLSRQAWLGIRKMLVLTFPPGSPLQTT